MTQGNGLSDAYTATLTRLKAQKGNKSILGLKVLLWVLFSERPLKTEEICHALGVELGSPDLDLENVPVLRTLLTSSLGLVTVETSSSTVRLVHFTLQEHLLSDSTLFHSPHSTIAEVCLTYLNFQCIRDLWPTLRSPPAAMPLLEYASYYWGHHTGKGMTENVKILALRLLDKFDEHISAQLISLRHNRNTGPLPRFDSKKGPIGFTGLHVTAFLGMAELLEALLEMKEWDVNARDNSLSTPLMWAARMGHQEVVKLLLERRDIKPDQASFVYGQTALYLAAFYGHEGIVKMILGREDINPNQIPTGYPCTPLSIAAHRGYEGVVNMLLEREDVNPNLADSRDSRTPLVDAASQGHEGVVKMLLDRNDIRIDIRDRENQTAHSVALSRGRDKIARMISERAASKSDTEDPGGQESLPSSAGDEEESVAEMELRDDHSNATAADPNGHLHPRQQTPIRRKGIGLRRLYSWFHR